MTPQIAREAHGLRVQQYVRGRRNANAETHVKYVVTCPRTFARAESNWIDVSLAEGILYLTVNQVLQRRNK